MLRITTSRNEVIDVPVQAIKLADGGDDTFHFFTTIAPPGLNIQQ